MSSGALSSQRTESASNTAARLRVAVMGSCVSRDAFGEPADHHSPILVDYLARSSLATLASEPAPIPPNLIRIASAFQRRMVRSDHERQALRMAQTGQYDILLIDLIDERFRLLRTPEGPLVTYSNEYASIAARPLPGELIDSGSDEHVRLWRAGMERLAQALEHSGALSKLRINRVYWAHKDTNDAPVPGFDAGQVEQANAFLAQRYHDLEQRFGSQVFINYDASLFLSDPHHKWGASAFHFTPAFYQETLRQLRRAQYSQPSPISMLTAASVAEKPAAEAARRRVAQIQASPKGLQVRLALPEAHGREFAFYLYRDQERVCTRWYTPRASTAFPCPTIAGDYHVVAFERDRASGNVDRHRTSALRLPHSRTYSPEQWGKPVFDYRAGQAIEVIDGVHRVLDEGQSSLDLLLDGFGESTPGTPIMVCFSGAVTKREAKVGPFFSGLQIGKACQLPTISVSDPTLNRTNDIGLAWYAGNEQHPDLIQRIAKLLDAISKSSNAPLILIGGSGGGFACLAAQTVLKAPASAVVWNPQTSITRYYPNAVYQYVACAFPELAQRFGVQRLRQEKAAPEQLAPCLDAAGVMHDLTRSRPQSSRSIVYLQNRSDHSHVERHMLPFAAVRQGIRWHDEQIATDPHGLAICVADWGDGHAPPERPALLAAIGALARGADSLAVARAFLESKNTSGMDPDADLHQAATTQDEPASRWNGPY